MPLIIARRYGQSVSLQSPNLGTVNVKLMPNNGSKLTGARLCIDAPDEVIIERSDAEHIDTKRVKRPWYISFYAAGCMYECRITTTNEVGVYHATCQKLPEWKDTGRIEYLAVSLSRYIAKSKNPQPQGSHE